MARNEQLYAGPAEVNGTPYENVEIWVASETTVAAVILDGGVQTVPINNPSLSFVDEKLTIEGEGGTIQALRPRQRRGSWLNHIVVDVSGQTVYEDVSILWTDQGVTIYTADGTAIEMPGASTRVQYGVKSIETWSLDPALSLKVSPARRGCGRCGGGRR